MPKRYYRPAPVNRSTVIHHFTIWKIYGDQWNERTGCGGDDLLTLERVIVLANRLVTRATKEVKRIVAVDNVTNTVVFEWHNVRRPNGQRAKRQAGMRWDNSV